MKTNKLTYAGKVTITIDGKQKTQASNAGTDVLFNSLYSILTGVYYGDQDIADVLPRYMSIVPTTILKEDDSVVTNYQEYIDTAFVTKSLDIVSRTYTSRSCKFTAYFPNSVATSGVPDKDDCYVLLLDSSSKIMAYANILSSTIAPVFGNVATTAVIEWEMTFANEKENTNG